MQSPEHADVADMNGSSVEPIAQDNAPTVNPQSGLSPRKPAKTVQQLLRGRLTQKLGDRIVYLIHCSEIGLYKIGITDDLYVRFSQLQCDSAFPLTVTATYLCWAPTAPLFEKLLHECFAHCRTHGEWFKLDESDLVFFDTECPLTLELRRYTPGKGITVFGSSHTEDEEEEHGHPFKW